MKALVVEPSRLVVLMLGAMFGKHGIEMVQVKTATEAFASLAHHRIDLLCFAYELADMSGIEFFTTARARGLIKHQPALLFASTHQKEVVVRALEAGVTECFAKNKLGQLDDFIGQFARSSHVRLTGSVLLVEDSATAALFCRQVLERMGLRVEHCTSAEQATVLFDTRHYDLVITDYVLDGSESGLSLIRAVRGNRSKKSQTPILAMSALNDVTRKVEVLRNGANDFVAKPVLAEEFEVRVANLLTMRRLVRRLESQHEMMLEMVMHDQLTSLFNRHYLQERLPAIFKEAQDKARPVSLLIVDIDYFKRINDSHGHKLGDQVLELVAELLQRQVHGREIAARVGGEEFVLILPGSDLNEAVSRAESLRRDCEVLEPAGLAVTVSIGIAERQVDEDYESLFKRADRAVYRAKEAGRNQVQTDGD